MQPELSPAELPIQDTPVYLKLAMWGLLAGMGGAVKYVSAVIRSPHRVTWKRFVTLFLANIFISSFCGLMGYMLVTTVTDSWAWHGLGAGMFGYLGTQGLDVVMLSLRRKIDPNSLLSALVPIPPSVDPAAPERAA